jgi:hypothetical protein
MGRCGSKEEMWLLFLLHIRVLSVLIVAWNSNFLSPDVEPSRQVNIIPTNSFVIL